MTRNKGSKGVVVNDSYGKKLINVEMWHWDYVKQLKLWRA